MVKESERSNENNSSATDTNKSRQIEKQTSIDKKSKCNIPARTSADMCMDGKIYEKRCQDEKCGNNDKCDKCKSFAKHNLEHVCNGSLSSSNADIDEVASLDLLPRVASPSARNLMRIKKQTYNNSDLDDSRLLLDKIVNDKDAMRDRGIERSASPLLLRDDVSQVHLDNCGSQFTVRHNPSQISLQDLEYGKNVKKKTRSKSLAGWSQGHQLALVDEESDSDVRTSLPVPVICMSEASNEEESKAEDNKED